YTTILPFTRVLSGLMDITVGILDVEISQGYLGRSVHSTAAKKLDLLVCVYSPIRMFAVLPEIYEGQTAIQFLKDVPTDWEDTKVLNGAIGEYITTVRKDINSGDWFLGSMTNEEARDFDISLSFLDPNARYEAQIYADAQGTDLNNTPEAIDISTKEVTATDNLKLHLGAGGGAAVRFKQISN